MPYYFAIRVISELPNVKNGKGSHAFTANQVRYIRLVILDETIIDRAYVGELKIYGTPSAGDPRATAAPVRAEYFVEKADYNACKRI